MVVFIDYMNVFNDARLAFGSPPFGPSDGQINPMQFGRLLAAREPLGTTRSRECAEVRVYRGRPDPRKEPRTYSAHMRQCAAWEQAGATVVTRPLRYPRSWPSEREEEKGIDVQIAIDMIMMAVTGALDVAVLASTDTDQRPVLEAFSAIPTEPRPVVEVATWRSESFSKKLQVKNVHVWHHFVEEPEFRAIRDTTDYNTAK
jgi:uncharacterized LabA/DUF88 family protein